MVCAKESDKPDPDELAQVVGQNALRIAELQSHVTQLENLLCAIKLWPEAFRDSDAYDALQEPYDESEEVIPFIKPQTEFLFRRPDKRK